MKLLLVFLVLGAVGAQDYKKIREEWKKLKEKDEHFLRVNKVYERLENAENDSSDTK